MPSITNDVLSRYLRPILKELLAQCNDGNRRKFARIYGDVETMEPSKIPWAISICERTIKSNVETEAQTQEK